MLTISRSVALLSAFAVLGVSALAVARDVTPISGDRTASASHVLDTCPPSACTIVMKTDRGGPPSRLVAVER